MPIVIIENVGKSVVMTKDGNGLEEETLQAHEIAADTSNRDAALAAYLSAAGYDPANYTAYFLAAGSTVPGPAFTRKEDGTFEAPK